MVASLASGEDFVVASIWGLKFMCWELSGKERSAPKSPRNVSRAFTCKANIQRRFPSFKIIFEKTELEQQKQHLIRRRRRLQALFIRREGAVTPHYSISQVGPGHVERTDISHTWKCIKMGMNLVIKQGAKWCLGNGQLLRFWWDSWAGPEPLSSLVAADFSGLLSAEVVADFWDADLGWIWQRFQHLIPADSCLAIASLVISHDPIQADRLFWTDSADGNYSVRAAYGMLTKENQVCSIDYVTFRGIRKLRCHERAKWFFWLAIKGVVLTNEERLRRHMSSCGDCSCCPGTAETLLHILRDCRFARSVWMDLLPPGNRYDFFSLPCPVWLRLFVLQDRYSILGRHGREVFVTAVWYIWKWRNDRVFKGTAFYGNKATFILATVEDWFVRDARLQGAAGRGARVMADRWIPPEDDMVKVNTDGAWKDGLGAAGGAVRNAQGEWIGGFVHKIGVCSIVAAELWGVVSGLRFVWSLGYRRVCLETDSTLVVLFLNKPVDRFHPLSSLVSLAQDLIARNWLCQIRHVYREANTVADRLASLALSFPVGVACLDFPPFEVVVLLESDSWGRATPRFVL